MDSSAITRHRRENRVDRWKFILTSPKAISEEWWSWGWRKPSSHLRYKKNKRLEGVIFVAIIHRLAPIVHSFLDLHGNKVSIGISYLKLLQEVVWPRLHQIDYRSALLWMQDGAPPHCTNEALPFLNDKFENRLICRRTDHPRPAHNPDLNRLEFHFWAAAQSQVYRETWLNQLTRPLRENLNRWLQSRDHYRKMCANALKQAMSCLQGEGGHFQQLL